jgi:hypothetical protein
VDFFRGSVGGVECFITRHAKLLGARLIADPFATLGAGDVRGIAFELAQSSATTWFGVDVSTKTPAQKVQWIEDEIKQSRLYVHMRLPRQGGPLDVFRIDFDDRLIYVTTRDWIDNTRPVNNVGWLQQNAVVIGVTIASSPDTRYFGFDFIEFTHKEKVEWLVDNITTMKRMEDGSLQRVLGSIRVFADDPSDQPGRSSSSSSSSPGGKKRTPK